MSEDALVKTSSTKSVGQKKKDHKRLNIALELYAFCDTIAKGTPILLPKGATIKRVLDRFLIDEEVKRGYIHVSTPPIGKRSLYERSGHFNLYKNDMNPPMEIEGEDYVARSVTCPNHYMVFASRPRSYKELPLRYAEMSLLMRRDQSGELSGLFRTNNFFLNDAHIFCSVENIKDEFVRVIDFIRYFNDKLGISSAITYRASLGADENQKYIVNKEVWAKAEKTLIEILDKANLDYLVCKDKACFYGPKLDVLMEDYAGRKGIISTVQLDFNLPERFDVSFINKEGKKERPVVIHRGLPFSVERTIGFLTEYYQGSFPLWLSPEQVRTIPVSDAHIPYAKEVEEVLLGQGIRVHCDFSDDNFTKKIKNSIIAKVPYALILGDKEMAKNCVTVKNRDTKEQTFLGLNEFVDRVTVEDKEYVISLGI